MVIVLNLTLSPLFFYFLSHYYKQAENKMKPKRRKVYNNMIQIMNNSTLNVDAFLHYVNSVRDNISSTESDKIAEYVNTYISICNEEGVDPLVALSQVLVETNNFGFTGRNKKTYNNFGGVRFGTRYQSFNTENDGIRTHVQLLKRFASNDPLVIESPNDYSIYNTNMVFGTVPYVMGLSGSWVNPGYNKNKYPDLKTAIENNDAYGCYIESKYEEVKKYIDSYTPVDATIATENNTDTLVDETSSTPVDVTISTEDSNVTSLTANETEVKPTAPPLSIKDVMSVTKTSVVVSTPSKKENSNVTVYKVLCGTFKDERRANVLKEKMKKKKLNTSIVNENGIYKLYSGSFENHDKAVSQMRSVLSKGISCSIVTINSAL